MNTVNVLFLRNYSQHSIVSVAESFSCETSVQEVEKDSDGKEKALLS